MTVRLRTRPPVKQDAIVDYLRGLITAGKLAPGDRLPPRAAIEDRFGVATMTVQRAFERLVEDGFVTVAGSQGSFVATAPPHLHRHVLVFPVAVGAPRWVRFWTMLSQEAQGFGLRQPSSIAIYHGVESDRQADGFVLLAADVAEKRIAGIIFAIDPWELKGTSILDAPGIPRVAFSGLSANTAVPGVALGGDGELFFRRALDQLAASGRKRIGLLTVPGLSGVHLETYRAGLAERGLVYQPGWVQVGVQSDPQWAAHLILAMFRGHAADRPDGLIIADDNLVDHACAGLIQLGLRVPEDLDVVAHANFPLAAPAILPVMRLGYDIPQAFATCVDLLAKQRARRRVPATTVIAPVFAHELAKSSPQDPPSTTRLEAWP